MSTISDDMRTRLVSLDLVGFTVTPAVSASESAASLGKATVSKQGINKAGLLKDSVSKVGLLKPGIAWRR